jgi:hypothetical protein
VFHPQHFTPPLNVSAHVGLLPAAMAATPLESPITSTGILLFVVVPSPNCPLLFNPQHFICPLDKSAQVWYSPAAMAATALESPITSIGILLLVAVPIPKFPYPFGPQHFTPPSEVNAQV